MPLFVRIRTIGLEEGDPLPIQTGAVLEALQLLSTPPALDLQPPDLVAVTIVPFLTPTAVLT